MASRVSPITLDDAAPYRRLPQFAPQAPIAATTITVSPKRRILGLPARTPVLTNLLHRTATNRITRQDAA